MKLTRIFAAVAACAVSVSAMAITSFAAKTITNANDGAAYVVDLTAESVEWNGGISGALVTITPASGWEETGIGGGVIFQGAGVEWSDGSKEFGVSGEGADCKNISGMTVNYTGSVIELKYDFGGAIFDSSADWGQFIVQAWWGGDFEVSDVKYLDLSGNVIGGAATTTTAAAADNNATTTTTAAAATTTAAANNNTAATTTAAAANAATGVEGVASVAALLTIAGAAVVISKKH